MVPAHLAWPSSSGMSRMAHEQFTSSDEGSNATLKHSKAEDTFGDALPEHCLDGVSPCSRVDNKVSHLCHAAHPENRHRDCTAGH